MTLKNGKAFFTAEDIQNMTVRNYTAEESKQNLRMYARKSCARRVILLAALLVTLFLAIYFNTTLYSFFFCIAVILLAAGFLLSEFIYRLNRKYATDSPYIEIVVEQKKEVETQYQNSVTTGPDSIHFYPVLGRDTTTNYESIWYLDKDAYRNVNAGDIVRKSIGDA